MAAKTKTAYFCNSCGNESAKWMGQCPSCKEWNSLIEELKVTGKPEPRQISTLSSIKQEATLIADVDSQQVGRIDMGSAELNRVLGGGLVPGSVVLLGGEPGIGKSTLLLQVALQLKGKKVLYLSGEESKQQIKLRADRIGYANDTCYLLNEINTQNIFQQVEKVGPDLLVVDSIQTLHTSYLESAPGSISQIRECSAELMKFAKETNTPVILIGHITKDGNIAGPKILEHMVDTVVYFEGDRNNSYRLLRSTKNRFGSTNELGIFEMAGDGLREVTDPSKVLTNTYDEVFSGVAVGSMVEGIRPMLIEVQALVSSAVYGTPQRSATGFDLRRLNMLLAVLEKRGGFKIGAKDVFLNIAGGLRVEDPGLDLGVVCAIMSSYLDISLERGDCFAAEIGLSGELRPVGRVEQRIAEAEKLGFKRMFIEVFDSNVAQANETHSFYIERLSAFAK